MSNIHSYKSVYVGVLQWLDGTCFILLNIYNFCKVRPDPRKLLLVWLGLRNGFENEKWWRKKEEEEEEEKVM